MTLETRKPVELEPIQSPSQVALPVLLEAIQALKKSQQQAPAQLPMAQQLPQAMMRKKTACRMQ